jgi:hypothetical protein
MKYDRKEIDERNNFHDRNFYRFKIEFELKLRFLSNFESRR